MSLSLNSRDVRVIAGIAAVAAGLAAAIIGAFTGNIPMITVGAGLLGAPGIATASSATNPTKGTPQ